MIGSSSTSQEEVDFLRRRVRGINALGAGISTFMYLVSVLIPWTVDGDPNLTHPALLWHAAGTLCLVATWAVCRADLKTARAVRLLEGIALVAAISCYVQMACNSARAQGPHLIALMAASLVFTGRAVYVPSSARRTLALGVAVAVPLVWSIHHVYATAPAGELNTLAASLEVDSVGAVAQVLSLVTFAWWVACVAVATAASSIIFGLRRTVRNIKRLGQYALEDQIGEGGMGRVYRAKHALLRRATAVKVLLSDRLGEEDVRRFEREVRLTASLTHPHTITVFDYGRTPEGLFYYAMELLDGATLREIVTVDGPQSPERVVHVMMETTAALVEAHDIGLIHRDVKPANIMLCRQGGMVDFTKLLDFGLVKPLNDEADVTMVEAVVGTPQYLSPESITSPGEVDARADLYALGAVGYYMLTGAHVFVGATIAEVVAHHLRTPPTAPSERLGTAVPAALEQLLLRCLSKDPDDRPQSAQEAHDALRACAIGPWTQEAARGWWDRHRESVEALRLPPPEGSHDDTFRIDLGSTLTRAP